MLLLILKLRIAKTVIGDNAIEFFSTGLTIVLYDVTPAKLFHDFGESRIIPACYFNKDIIEVIGKVFGNCSGYYFLNSIQVF
jgi:hypothetical protein